MKEPIYLKCQCYGSMLECQYDEEFKDCNITIWQRGRNGVLSWQNRIRWIWEIIKTGNPWGDDIMLTKEDALKLANYIQENSKI